MSSRAARPPLTGGCSCGRNRFAITIPPETTEIARVFFDHSLAHRKNLASPLTSWLRVPLGWYRSTTYAQQEDETHPQIRKVYSEARGKRCFCGFCGTPLSYWTEEEPDEKDWICVTLGSLGEEELRGLGELGVLPEEKGEKTVRRDGGKEGLEWFDGLVEGSRLGRMRRWGQREEGRGWVVEWEVVEMVEGETADEEVGGVKRKIGEVEDVGMDG